MIHLVTGAAGFIGSHLVDVLLEKGDKVIAVDNFYTGRSENIKHHYSNDSFVFYQNDVETVDIEPAVDQIWHLACPASPIHYQRDPLKTIRTCYEGTLNMLCLAQSTGARMLLASTSEIYGDPLVHPQTENYLGNVNTLGPRACYDEGKRIAETLAFNYWMQHSVSIRVARIFNTYGPRMAIKDGRVISNFIVQALQNKPLTIYGSGSTTRSFCYVSDTVAGLQHIMNANGDWVFNVGNPQEITLSFLAKQIAEKTNPALPSTYHAKPQDDPQRRMPDITKITASTGWTPKVTLDDGLNQTISYFKHQLVNV